MTPRTLLRSSRAVLLAATVLLVGGCGAGNRLFVNPDADQGFYRKVAVLPFANVSGNGLAGPRVARAFVTELTIANLYEIVEPEPMAERLRNGGAELDGTGHYFPNEKVQQIVTQAGAQGWIVGTVTEYQMQRHHDADIPILGFDIQLVDAATLNVVWRVTVVGKGKGRVPVVGGGLRTLGQLTQSACESAVHDLRSKLK
jgi:curli biogenesis system outer membrane secretion channel CsgG